MLKKIKTAFHEFNNKRDYSGFEKRLKKVSIGLNAIELVDLLFSDDVFNHLWPKQVKYEILEFSKLIEKLNPKNIIEIGTASGATLFLLTKLSSPDSKIMSIDLPSGSFGGGYSKWQGDFFKSFIKPTQQMECLRASSHEISSLNSAKSYFKDSKIDLLFIDGDHTYEGVKKDFELYAPLVSDNGIIVFHDIALHDPDSLCKVSVFWEEIKNNFHFEEIIYDKNQKWAGIGILKKC
jgi:predicted O-methyltransferase YrrM